MLRSDGTVAVVVGPPPPPPPQAVRITPTAARAGNSRDSFMKTSLCRHLVSCCLLPGGAGRECAGRQGLLSGPAAAKHYAHGWGLSRMRAVSHRLLFGLLTNRPVQP